MLPVSIRILLSSRLKLFHDGGRYIETSPLICSDWFLYDKGPCHERVK